MTDMARAVEGAPWKFLWLALAAGLVGCQAGPSPLGEPLPDTGSGVESLREAIELLEDSSRPWPEKRACWRKARQAGWEAALHEVFRERAEREPENAQAYVDLGNLALLGLLEEGASGRRARLAMAADRHYEQALLLDPDHWEARFQRAAGLAHWPSILGRRGEALSGLERLMRDQERLPAEERFAWTYLLLGALQSDMGSQAEAAGTWRRGLERHPEAHALREKVGGNEGR